MALKSALDDLRENTLAAVAGLVGKVAYLAGLRQQARAGYAHWGLSRTYGEEGSQKAFAKAHRELFLKVLRTPLRDLREDVSVSSAEAKVPTQEYVEKLRMRAEDLLPGDLGGGSARHFSSVLHALSSLIGHRDQSPPDANPPA